MYTAESLSTNWLLQPSVLRIREQCNLHVECIDPTLPSDVVKTSVKLVMFSELTDFQLQYYKFDPDYEAIITYDCSRSRRYFKVVDVRTLKPMLPVTGDHAIVVKDSACVKATDPNRKSWSCDVTGSDLVGRVLEFKRMDWRLKMKKAERERRIEERKRKGLETPGEEEEQVASLRFIEPFGSVPAGAYIRIPLDCVCRFANLKES